MRDGAKVLEELVLEPEMSDDSENIVRGIEELDIAEVRSGGANHGFEEFLNAGIAPKLGKRIGTARNTGSRIFRIHAVCTRGNGIRDKGFPGEDRLDGRDQVVTCAGLDHVTGCAVAHRLFRKLRNAKSCQDENFALGKDIPYPASCLHPV